MIEFKAEDCENDIAWGCVFFLVLRTMGFCIAFMSLVSKMYRVHVIFNPQLVLDVQLKSYLRTFSVSLFFFQKKPQKLALFCRLTITMFDSNFLEKFQTSLTKSKTFFHNRNLTGLLEYFLFEQNIFHAF